MPQHATGQDKTILENRLEALEHELGLIRSAPGQFYLIIDFPASQILLKADANLLRACPIKHAAYNLRTNTHLLAFVQRVDPVTIEPGNDGLRHRGRNLPLDFSTRLTEGPRHHSRLYFYPHFVLQSEDLTPANISYALLSNTDIKALGSALQHAHQAIVIPPLSSQGLPH